MVQNELKNPTNKRVKKIIYTSVSIELLLYSISSQFGYFSFLNSTPDLLIDRAYGFEGIDYFMIIGKLVIVFDLLGSYLVSQAPCSD